MIIVPDPKELVAKIRQACTERCYTINDVISLMKEKGHYPVAPATVSRLLSGDSDDSNYDYLKTILPIYNTLFEFDDVSNDGGKIQAMKALLEYKMECIEDLKKQLDAKEEEHRAEIDRIKVKYHEKMDKETKRFQEIMEFRGNQIDLKDEYIKQLMQDNSKLVDHIVNCPYRGKCE